MVERGLWGWCGWFDVVEGSGRADEGELCEETTAIAALGATGAALRRGQLLDSEICGWIVVLLLWRWICRAG